MNPARLPARLFARRRLLAGLVPVLLAAAALPLLAPTCGGGEEGGKTFSRNSLIIPMDRCYQGQTDSITPAGAPGCPQAADTGDVIKAYGLVYELIRNDVAVYWLIGDVTNGGAKGSLTAYDVSIQYNGGFPVLSYDWNANGLGSAPTAANTVRYMGGPFVVDGSDYAKAIAILQQYKATFQTVNVHVSNVAFRGYVKKTMAGGWNAGATVPPKIALLDIGSGNLSTRVAQTVCTGATDTTHACDGSFCISAPKNSEQVIEGYLISAGIGGSTTCPNPNSCPGGVAAGPHGQIYDKLTMADFLPAPGGDWTTTNLSKNGYQILWVPHWVAPGSCSAAPRNAAGDIYACACLATRYPQATVDAALRTIGAFLLAGGDVFGECAGLGSFEGVLNGSNQPTIDYQDAVPESRFQTTTGMKINQKSPGTALVPGSFSSPLLQLGDFPFRPVGGAIQIFKPADAYVAAPGVTRLISDATDTTLDYFTLLPRSGLKGSAVYLAGHSYSNRQGTFQIGGSRLVLNTLFNLGAGCTQSGVACVTQSLGVCAKGTLTCTPAGEPVCLQTTTASPEICNGLDDDCDGSVDEGLETACYGGPAATKDVGLCRAGVQSCEPKPDGSYAMGACVGEIRPQPEVCNALDDDCDGSPDETLEQACYFGPLASLDASGVPMGVCKAGTQACSSGNWGECSICPAGTPSTCQILPSAEVCTTGTTQLDENCDGRVNEVGVEGCGTCTPDQTIGCYTGPAGTAGTGICKVGSQTCLANGAWGGCAGQILPQLEVCKDGVDQNCNGMADDNSTACAACRTGERQACYTGPAASLDASGVPMGVCQTGTQGCLNGDFGGTCLGQVEPSPEELCDGKDNNCNGLVDDGAACTSGFACVNGLCVPSSCGVERPCPDGYLCGTTGTCELALLGCGGQTCPAGFACDFGTCIDPCAGIACATGATCASGACVGGACYFTGCSGGELCLAGECTADPCAGLSCPSGTFCRQGDCVQACTFVSCAAGEMCGVDGFCEPDRCAGKTCSASGETCVDGACIADACFGKGCGSGQVCKDGVCLDDPCTGVSCPAGACLGGQCYTTGQLTNTSAARPGDSSGCGCGAGSASPLAALLVLFAVPLARRRRKQGGGLALLLVAMALLGAACKQEEPFDPAKCGPTATCEGANRCVDLQSDSDYCGECAIACGEGQVCGAGICGPGDGVAPFVKTVSPAAAAKGSLDPVAVDLGGLRFAPGATVRVRSPSGTRTYDTVFVDAGHLRVLLDLSAAEPTTFFLRVVNNPDPLIHVISNAVPFNVVTPSPAITSLTPNAIPAGASTDVLVAGTGLITSSRCKIRGLAIVEQAVPTSLVAGGLSCTVDATSLQPASLSSGYVLWVVNDAVPTALVSNELPFAVTSDGPVLDDVSPSSAAAATTVSLTLTGSNFDVTTTAFFDGGSGFGPVSTSYVDSSRLIVPQFVTPACAATCTFQLEVRSGSGIPSAARPFVVSATQAQITGLSPGTGYQGETVPLTFTGSFFPLNAQIQVQAPGEGAFRPPLTSTGNTTTAVNASLNLTGQPEGAWSVRLFYPSNSTASAAYGFRVLSNQAVLRDAAPRGEMQGRSFPVTLTATNLRPAATPSPAFGIRVAFSGTGVKLVPTAVSINPPGSGTGTVTVNVSTAGLNTGSYSLMLENPNAAPSNPLSFNVTPGPPTVTSVSPVSAAQSQSRVPVTLRGTNFAKPDAAGNGGSIVHIAAPALGVTDFAVPAADTTVLSPTELLVQLDTRSGVPGSYDVSVWNPSGLTTPQKSTVLTGAFTILP